MDCKCYADLASNGKPIILKCPLCKSAPDLYEALMAWDKLRAMQPLDSGADIDAILQECSEITDKALAKAESKGER